MARSSLRRLVVIARGVLAASLGVGSTAHAHAQQSTSEPPGRGPVVSFSLESTAGGRTSVAAMRGKVVVIFYEDRDHRDDNTELKGVLVRFVGGNEVRSEVAILPVANVSGLDFAPAATIVRAAVRSAARDVGVPFLLDWAGTLQAAPISLRDGASCVLVLDRAGRVVFRSAGPVTGDARSQFFRALRRAIRDRDGDGQPDAPARPAAPGAQHAAGAGTPTATPH